MKLSNLFAYSYKPQRNSEDDLVDQKDCFKLELGKLKKRNSGIFLHKKWLELKGNRQYFGLVNKTIIIHCIKFSIALRQWVEGKGCIPNLTIVFKEFEIAFKIITFKLELSWTSFIDEIWISRALFSSFLYYCMKILYSV